MTRDKLDAEAQRRGLYPSALHFIESRTACPHGTTKGKCEVCREDIDPKFWTDRLIASYSVLSYKRPDGKFSVHVIKDGAQIGELVIEADRYDGFELLDVLRRIWDE